MKSPAPSTSAQPFSIRLREGIREVHTRAEKNAFIRGFLRGTATPASYIRLLAGLHPVYQAMEEETCRLAAIDPTLGRFHFPVLFRLAALERDLVFLAGPEWARTVTPMPAALAYARRIREVSASAEPIRLVGHLYTRYLGDLSGGQILARIAERSLGVRIGAGLDFYDFDQVSDIPAMKAFYRSRLDELDTLPDAAKATAAVIDEADISFRHNIAIFESLEGNGLLSFLRNLPLPWVRAQPLGAASWAASPAA